MYNTSIERRESSKPGTWPVLDIWAHDEVSKAKQKRWDVVMADLILTREDRQKINSWVMGWCNKGDVKVDKSLNIEFLDDLTSVQLLGKDYGKSDRIVAYFTKVGFSEVAEFVLKRGAWYHLKPEPITKKVVRYHNVSKLSDIDGLVDAADQAVSENWDWVQGGLRSIIHRLALQVIKDRLRIFWPLDLEKALRSQTLRQLAVPPCSFVVLIDLAKSSEGRDGLSPEAYWEDLEVFFEKIYECVYTHEGWIESFLGDGVLAHFGTLPWIEEQRQTHDAFEKSLIVFLRDVSQINVPDFASYVRVMATCLVPARSDTGVVGSQKGRASLITSSDEINTCAHIMNKVFKGRFFSDCPVRIAFLDPTGSPVSDVLKASLKQVGRPEKQNARTTAALLRGQPISEATIYLVKP